MMDRIKNFINEARNKVAYQTGYDSATVDTASPYSPYPEGSSQHKEWTRGRSVGAAFKDGLSKAKAQQAAVKHATWHSVSQLNPHDHGVKAHAWKQGVKHHFGIKEEDDFVDISEARSQIKHKNGVFTSNGKVKWVKASYAPA